MSIEGALKCFAENRSTYEAGVKSARVDVNSLEKWNLYNWLLALAETARDLQGQVDSVRRSVERGPNR